MSENRVRQRYIDFKNGRINVYDQTYSGQLSLVPADLSKKINEKIRENCRFTITDFPNISP